MSLPSTGDDNWGVPLNQYITNVVLAQANTAAGNITAHVSGSDPHGDRAYALGLVSPLTSGINGPNGLLQLDGTGRIPSSTLPTGGGRTSTFDVVKDYSAPTNGTAASSAIQSALNDAGTDGGGEVWVGDGTFGIDTTLYVPSNVWLHLSPGATMSRIVNGGSGLAPAYMVANFNGSVSSAGAGNILIEGGSWIFDSQAATGAPMAFATGSNIVVQNTIIRTLTGKADILLAGMTGFGVRDAIFTPATPSTRATYSSAMPAVRVENAVSGVISGLNGAMYTASPCSFVTIESCAITGATASDGTGLYTAFGGMAGTTAPQSGSFHNSILVAHNGAVALPYNAVYPANWQSMTVTSNQFNINNGVTSTATWSPSAPGSTNQVVANNGVGDPSSAATTLGAWKTSNTVRTSTTTLTLDPDLQVSVVASAVYAVNVQVNYASNSTTEGILFDFQEPSGAVFEYTEIEAITTGGTAGIYSNTAGISDFASTGGSSNSLSLSAFGLLRTGGASGTFGIKWAQDVSSSTSLTVFNGSFMTLTRLA